MNLVSGSRVNHQCEIVALGHLCVSENNELKVGENSNYKSFNLGCNDFISCITRFIAQISAFFTQAFLIGFFIPNIISAQ